MINEVVNVYNFLVKKGQISVIYEGGDGSQPVLSVRGKTLPEAWQNAMIALWVKGIDVPTSFDRPGDPRSKDASVTVIVEEPFREPRIHKWFPAGLESLEHYRLEVVAGVHDHWINRFGKEWNYTYHERLRAYSVDDNRIDQIENLEHIIEQKIRKGEGVVNRRFQIITWMPFVDPFIKDPPCLQRLHFRLLPKQGGYVLNLNTYWRSRDGFKAWFMNAYAITDLQRLIALELSERSNVKIALGRYCDTSDSLHIYGKDFYGHGGFEGFLERIIRAPIEDLTWTTEFAKPIFQEARRLLAAQLYYENKIGKKATVPAEVDWKNFPYPKEWDR